MMDNIIREIKYKLRNMYVGYRFDVIYSVANTTFTVTAYKQQDTLGSISFISTTPTTEFWESVQAWMVPLIKSTLR
jgi:hypothetical protein